ncbi:MAG TPA: hypothetical protein VMT55_04820, partial [Candidatus Sulfotelmatobacter sp.]|nr:hypothetical protein [Candidatus Sulfotelmatobacter sp.]
MEDLRSKSYKELQKIGAALGFAPYKMEAVFRLIHHSLKEEVGELTALSKKEREILAADHFIDR